MSFPSCFNPMYFVNIDISPPNSKVVTKTITKVELTRSELLGDRAGLIYRLKAKAIAPLIVPLYQIISTC